MAGGGVVQRQVLYLGELNDNQRAGWVRTIEAFSGKKPKAKQLALFPDDRKELPIMACETVQIQLDKIELRRPREWGTCWLGLYLWDMLGGRLFAGAERQAVSLFGFVAQASR